MIVHLKRHGPLVMFLDETLHEVLFQWTDIIIRCYWFSQGDIVHTQEKGRKVALEILRRLKKLN